MTEPLVSMLGFLANTDDSDDILQGSFQPLVDIDYYSELLLQEMRMPENVQQNPMKETNVTIQKNQQAWKKQKEAISSDPNGLTFSHYKAGSADPHINLFDTTLRNLPYLFGFSPSHWQDITDVEILKKAGVYDIE